MSLCFCRLWAAPVSLVESGLVRVSYEFKENREQSSRKRETGCPSHPSSFNSLTSLSSIQGWQFDTVQNILSSCLCCLVFWGSSVGAEIEWTGRIYLNQQRPYDSSLTSYMWHAWKLHSIPSSQRGDLPPPHSRIPASPTLHSRLFSLCCDSLTREHVTSANFESRGKSSLPLPPFFPSRNHKEIFLD
jgi:hypothetical protein